MSHLTPPIARRHGSPVLGARYLHERPTPDTEDGTSARVAATDSSPVTVSLQRKADGGVDVFTIDLATPVRALYTSMRAFYAGC